MKRAVFISVLSLLGFQSPGVLPTSRLYLNKFRSNELLNDAKEASTEKKYIKSYKGSVKPFSDQVTKNWLGGKLFIHSNHARKNAGHPCSNLPMVISPTKHKVKVSNYFNTLVKVPP